MKNTLTKMSNDEIRTYINSLKQSLKISYDDYHRAMITGMVKGFEECLLLRHNQIKDKISKLDCDFDITLDQTQSIIIRNMVIAMCTVIYTNCNKPNCIGDKLWESLKSQSNEINKEKAKREEFEKRKESPKNLREILANKVDDLYD